MDQEQTIGASNYDRPLPHWVPQPVKERVIGQKNQEEWSSLINQELHADLQIEEHLPVNEEQAAGFYSQMARSIIEASNELRLPFPRTGLSTRWKDYRRSKEESSSNARVSPDEYLVQFSPVWIEQAIQLTPFPQKLEVDRLVRHEMLHLWEIIHLPEVQADTKEKLELIKQQRPGIYPEVKQLLTGKEMRAKLFELEGLKKEDTKTVRQFLYKSLILLLKKAEISRREKRRKQLGISF